MFYKTKENLFNQIHVYSCFVIDKVTGKQKKLMKIIMKARMQSIIMTEIQHGVLLLLKFQII